MLYLFSKPLALPPISKTSISVTQPGVSSLWNQNELEPARVHRLGLDLEIAVGGAGLGVQGGGSVVLVALLLDLGRQLFLPHGQVELAVRHGDVLVAEQGGLTALPPVHAQRPLAAVEFLALELVAHRLELDPAALVLLIGQGKGIGDVLGGFAKRASAIPNLGGAFFRRGGSSSGTEGQQDGREQGSFHGRVPPIALIVRGANVSR